MTTLKELLSVPRFSDLHVLNDEANLDSPVESIEITETPDIEFYISDHVFLLSTAMSFKDNQKDLIPFIDSLIKMKAAGLGIKVNRFLGKIDPEVLAYANSKSFPLIEIPGISPLGTLLHQMLNYLWDTKRDEVDYAMDTQQTFSKLLISGADNDYFISELGKIIKNPVVLLDPYYNVMASSKHLKNSKETAAYYADQVWQHYQAIQLTQDNFLITGLSSKKTHVAVYPIKAYNNFPHYLLVFHPEKMPYPMSSFAIDKQHLFFHLLFIKILS